MLEQIKANPKSFKVKKLFGPYMGIVHLPDEILNPLIALTDTLLHDPKTKSFGKLLAGIIKKEKAILKSDLQKTGTEKFLEAAIRNYVLNCSQFNLHDLESNKINSYIKSAWVVSQYQNEYNPMHGHSGCEISGVIYLKTPNVKGRRKLKDKKDLDGDITFMYNGASIRTGEILDSGSASFKPFPGLMLIFPSYLPHAVYPFLGEEERRSIAFNARYQIIRESNGKSQYIAGDPQGFKIHEPYFK